MGHGEEIERDRPEIDMASVLDLSEFRSTDTELGEFALDETER